MRSEALYANFIQLVRVYRIVIQDRKGEQGRVCGRVVNLKNGPRKSSLNIDLVQA